MNKKILSLLSAVAMIFVMASCDKDSGTPEVTETYQQFATLISTSQNGTVFEVVNNATSPVRRLTSVDMVPAYLAKPGERLMIVYQLINGTSTDGSGAISLLAASPVVNGTVEEKTASETDDWKTNTIQNPVFSLTGDYLNMTFDGLLRNDVKSAVLVADADTMDEKFPTLYLCYTSDDPATGAWKTIFASYDVTLIMNNLKYDGFILKCSNETGSDSFKFNRQGEIQPLND